jgi:peroxiredoxin
LIEETGMMLRSLFPFLGWLLSVVSFAGDSPGANITLHTADGRTVTPFSARNQKATVLVFLMHDCPITNASTPELARLAEEFTPKGIQFFGVYATETAAEITAHRRDYGLPFEGLLDPTMRLARLAGATRAPEAAVFSPDGTLLYRGRIDDRATKPGAMRATARQRNLHLALEAVLGGRQPEPKFTSSIGCYLSAK